MTHINRRAFLRASTFSAASVLLVACAAPAPAPAAVPAAPPAPTSAPQPTAAPAAAAKPPAEAKTTVVWWHHWAEEDSKKKVLNAFIDDYQKQHPNVQINIRWWQKAEMYPVAKNAFIAGRDFPDIMYGPENPFIEAGWFEDHASIIDWSQMQEGAKERTTRTVAGKTGVWDPPLESGCDDIYYNPKIFDKVGIKIPESKQFTADEFVEVCQKIRAGGFDPLSQGIGDRTYPGRYPFNYALLANLGANDYKAIYAGELEWTKPGVRAALEYGAKLSKIPMMPPTFATMKLAESHQYFHTPPSGKDLPRAAMFFVGTWYTGRAFVAPDKGGQPEDFRVSFLKYPTFPDGKGNGLKQGGGGGGGGSVAAVGKVKDVCKDMVRSFMTIKYGSLWLGWTYVPTELKTDPKQVPTGPYQWYAEEFARTHADQVYCTLTTATPPALDQAMTAALNEGIPQNLITVDKAIELLEKGRTTK
jgi:multiple sugar transport system substrate-binding protein